jgi:arylsulfatase A-like enzyme
VLPEGQMNILLVTLDTTRADHMASYGYFRTTTPVLDELASRSIFFEHLVVPMATTLPAHTSLLTGTHPMEHGVMANLKHGGLQFEASENLRSVVEVAKDAGYRTGAFVSATPLKPGAGIEAGFDRYDYPRAPNRRGAYTTAEAIKWLSKRRKQGKPFFLWVHYFDPHSPFEPPQPYAGRFVPDERVRAMAAERQLTDGVERPSGRPVAIPEDPCLYDGELAYMDAQIGRLLGALRSGGHAEQTVVAVVGDHGEGMGQHDFAGHGLAWHEQLHAPFFLHVPEHPPQVVKHTVAMHDVMPTLLGLVDLPGEQTWLEQTSGRDVLAHPGNTRVLSTSSGRQALLGTSTQTSLTVGSWHYLREEGRADRLFDLKSDPHTLHDVAAVWPLHLHTMKRWTDEELRRTEARGAALGVRKTTAADAERIEQLKELGYLVE